MKKAVNNVGRLLGWGLCRIYDLRGPSATARPCSSRFRAGVDVSVLSVGICRSGCVPADTPRTFTWFDPLERIMMVLLPSANVFESGRGGLLECVAAVFI